MKTARVQRVSIFSRLGQVGFTLVEIAVSLFIITLVLGSLLIPIATQIEQRQISETQRTMDEIREALLGFAVANGYLPCPDQAGGIANDGNEDVNPATGTCSTISGAAPNTIATGNLPWVTLGLGQQDAWGNRVRYVVLETYARRSPSAPGFSLSTAGGIRVCSATACPGSTTLTTTGIAVLISHGKNGFGGINATTNLVNTLPTSPNEIDNTNNDGDIVSTTQSNVAGNEFDDLVIWLPKYIFNSRMVAAGKLP